MMKNFNKTKLAAAVGSAALAMAMSSPANAVVVVGGSNGWEISFDGNINLFYNQIDFEVTSGGVPATTAVSAATLGTTATVPVSTDSAHLNEGLLPAFFSFTAKSPTVNGLTGTARISFAPDSSNAKNTRQDKGGSAIDMREVYASVDGSFGTIGFGRTLGLYQRQAILKDMTLFGVGAVASADGGGTTLGRIGFGYVYPEFRTAFRYRTPSVNGFQLEVGVFDPQEPAPGFSLAAFETDTPQFQAEATYATSFQGGNFNAWVGGIWQEMESQALTAPGDVTSAGWNAGAQASMAGFEITGSYYDGEALGTLLKWFGAAGAGGALAAPGFACTTAVGCQEADNDGFYIQGTYTFAGKTKVGVSYGESNQDSETAPFAFNDVENEMWTVGIYHDVTSWLRLVAEYNDQDSTSRTPAGAPVAGIEAQTFSVGGFLFW
jgi:hypothetical protein